MEMQVIQTPVAVKLAREFEKYASTPELAREAVDWDERAKYARKKYMERGKKQLEPKIKALEQALQKEQQARQKEQQVRQKEQQARQKEQQAQNNLIAQMQQQMLDAGLTPITMQTQESTQSSNTTVTFGNKKPSNDDPTKPKKNHNASY